MVLGLYTALLPKSKHLVNKEVTAEQVAIQDVVESGGGQVSPKGIPSVIIDKPLQDNELYSIESDGLSLKFSKIGGYLKEVYDKKNRSILSIGNIGLVQQWADHPFTLSEITRGVVFSYMTADGLEIQKTFRIKSDNSVELTIVLSGTTLSKSTSYDILGGSFSPSKEKNQLSARYYESCAIVNGIVQRKGVLGLKKPIVLDGHILWAGLRDQYFCSIFLPQFNVNKGVVEKIGDNVGTLFSIPARTIGPADSRIEDVYKLYVGIQDETSLRAFGSEAERMISYGTFDPISKALLFILKLSYKLTKSWGLAIIFITIFVYLLLFPLSLKSMLSMKRMQAIQPKIEELKAKYKDNHQKLNMEIMDLYRREKVNPFGGCLPMLLQIPVFFALYQLLVRLMNLRGSTFLWIKDLSEPDRLFTFPNSFPVIGNELNILPLLMAITMLFQQKITASQASATPEAAQQQKIMMIVMPVMFGFLFYKLPAGLVLYWFVNSLLMLIFQWKISAKKA